MLLRLLVLVLAEVRKPNWSFLIANAVNHANPVVISFPVVNNKPIAGKMSFSSSYLEKCSSNFVSFMTYDHNEYDHSNLADELGKSLGNPLGQSLYPDSIQN